MSGSAAAAAAAAAKRRSRATLAHVSFDANLRSSLVHLPIALFGPLVERNVPAQSIVVELIRCHADGTDVSYGEDATSTHIDKIYVGWSGMSAALPSAASSGTFSTASMQATSVLSLSPTLATAFQPPLVDGASVRITLLRSPPLPTASRIDVVPLTPDDWEILSLNAGEVEDNMLAQVRAARTGMTIAVHVGPRGHTICRFRVQSCDPPTQDYEATDNDGSLARAVRLSTDTEVVIAPQTRKTATEPIAEPPSQLQFGNGATAEAQGRGNSQPGEEDQGITTALGAQNYLARSPFRLLPSSFARQVPFARSSPVLLHPDDAHILTLAFGTAQGRCAITKMPSPVAPTIFASSDAGTSGSRATTLHAPSSTSNGEERTTPRKQDEGLTNGSADATTAAATAAPARATTSTYYGAVSLTEDTEQQGLWPRRQVYVTEEIRRKLGLRDFDLVRFSAPSPSSSNAASRPSSPEPETADKDGTPVLAGYDAVLNTCLTAITNAFRLRRWSAMRAALTPSASLQLFNGNSGLLLTGGPGSGKTSMAKVLAQRVAAPGSLVSTILIDCTGHSEERLSSMRTLFDQWLAAAVWHSPTLLILDNLDRIVPADQEHVDSPRGAQVAEALMHRIREVTSQHAVFVLATAQSHLALHRACSVHHVFGDTVELKAPTKEARRAILEHLVNQRASLTPWELNLTTVAGQTEGYMPADLRDLVERAVHQSAVRSLEQRQKELEGGQNGTAVVASTTSDATVPPPSRRTLTMDDFAAAQRGFTPLSLRDIKLTQSATRWSDIGGLQETRRVLRETLEWPTKYAKVFAQCPLRLRSGLLLYGYPGCGKTLLAGAVARECGLNFISVKGPEILNKYIGASEKSVRDLFDRAQAAKPCVLFFDEFDSIAPKRGHDSTGVTDRVVNQLLTQMDGAEGLSGVYVLAATSRPDLIDSALLRPGRLDKSLLCDLPSLEDRLDILQVLCQGNRIHLADDVDLHKWAQRTAGFSGADLQALVYNANLEAIHAGMGDKAHNRAAGDKPGQPPTQNGLAAATSTADAPTVRFVRLGGAAGGKGGLTNGQSTTMSGAERQALQRRMELMALNARQPQGGSQLETASNLTSTGAAPAKAANVVTEALLQKCLRSTRQSVPADEQRRLGAIYRQFVGERSGEFPNGEASREVGARQSLM